MLMHWGIARQSLTKCVPLVAMGVWQDYFGALLFTRLMGPRVMHVSVANSSTVRAWGHCGSPTVDATNDARGLRGSVAKTELTLLLLNLLNGTNTVDISKVTRPEATGASAASAPRVDYILTPSSASKAVSEDGNVLQSDMVNLNGRPLAMVGDRLPALDGKEVDGAAVTTLKLPPLAVAFTVIQNPSVC